MAGGKGPILIVDDDVDVREALRDALEDGGFETVMAPSGPAGLAYLRSSPPPALILLDWMMPGMDGPEFFATLKKDSGLARIPVILLTADPRTRAKARELGVTDFLDKPVELDRLLSTVAKYAR
jgi:CheY-like chemotaxis protein